jgi:hypothetical protein
MVTETPHPTPDSTRAARRIIAAAGMAAAIVMCVGGSIESAGTYPLTLTLDAQAKTANASVASSVTIHVDRLMEENRRTRVMDALKRGGYTTFLPALRALPRIGTIGVGQRTVDVKYATEQADGDGRRLVLVADRPLFFLGGDPAKTHDGYQLTLVDLRVDGRGDVTGTMAGAARVKPSPDGGVIVDDYGEAPVQLSGPPAKPKSNEH